MQDSWKKYVTTPMGVGLAVIIITVVTAGLVAAYIQYLASKELEQHLEATLDDSVYLLKDVLNRQKTAVHHWANDANVVASTERLLRGEVQEKSLTELHLKLNAIGGARNYFDYKIFDLQGNVIVSGSDAFAQDEAQSVRDNTIIQRVIAGETVITHPFIASYPRKDKQGRIHSKLVLMMTLAPIKDSLGNTIAILAFEFDPDTLITAVFHYNQVGESGETYAIDQSGLLLTHVKFAQQLVEIGLLDARTPNPAMQIMMRDPGVNLLLSPNALPDNLNQQPLTQMAQSLSQKQSGMNLQGYRDYRGVEVIGVWKWDDELQMGFVTETDKDEAFVLYNWMAISILFGVLFVVLMVLIVMLVYRHNAHKHSSELQLRDSMVSHSADGIILVDQDFTIQIVNPALCNLFGYREAELLGQKVEILIPEQQRQHHAEYAQTTELHGPRIFDQHRELFGRKKDGFKFPIDITISPMIVDDKRYFIGILRDITEKINNDRMLIDAKEAAELAEKEAEEASRAKSEFLSKMSHELRTPLNAILGFAQILELDELDSDQTESVLMIKNAGSHLLNLINDILNLARIESGQLTVSLEHVELKTVIEELVPLVQEQLKPLSLSLNTEYFVDGAIWVKADHLRLKQVILNLLSNAIKYNKQGGSVNILISQEEASTVRISVQDSGLGMDEHQLSHLFEPFNRLDVNDAIEGTGIGLVISRELLKLMDANIGVESVKGVGSTFWIELSVLEEHKLEEPMAESVTGAESGQNNSAASTSTVSVLYVEDNPANLMVVRQLLKRYPRYHLSEAVSAEDGLDMIRQQKPNIVLMDINLPGMSGFEALEVIKQEGLKASMKVVALSANAMNTQVSQGLEAGFDEYLTKPIDFAALIATLDKLSA